jgi:iron uptake system component EfeO
MKEALGYFSRKAAEAAPKVKELDNAVKSGNLSRAKAAYVVARPEYEQIEVLAPGFSEVDCWIDCRACALSHP